jgi:hypothetical protein
VGGRRRPLSARSAWAIVAFAEGDEDVLAALAPAERPRAKARLELRAAELLREIAEERRASKR